LVRLAETVAVHQHRDGLAGLAGGEGERTGSALVVAAGGSAAVGGGEGNGDRLAGGGRQSDRERGRPGAGVALGHRRLADGNLRLIRWGQQVGMSGAGEEGAFPNDLAGIVDRLGVPEVMKGRVRVVEVVGHAVAPEYRELGGATFTKVLCCETNHLAEI